MKLTHWLVRYGIAVLVVLASLAILSIPVIGPGLVTILFLAVLISAWQGGIGPGLFATLLIECFAILNAWNHPPPSRIIKIVELSAFFGLGALITLIVEALHAAPACRGQPAMAVRRADQHRRRSDRHRYPGAGGLHEPRGPVALRLDG